MRKIASVVFACAILAAAQNRGRHDAGADVVSRWMPSPPIRSRTRKIVGVSRLRY